MRIYLDHNATTPLRPEVVDAMLPVLRNDFGNPSSTHSEGARARALLEQARERVAALVGAKPSEVIFTAGASEANNTAIQSAARHALRQGHHLVTTTAEHPSVTEPHLALEREGWKVTWLPVNQEGRIHVDQLCPVLGDETVLVTLLWANNETGVIQPVADLVAAARRARVPVLLDATQAAGKVPVDLAAVPAQFLSLSAHKLNGPKGVGALVVRGETELAPLILGGPQERRRRGGTENLPGAVGFGVACELASRELVERGARLASLRDRLWEGIHARIPDAVRNGAADHVLPNTLNLCFPGLAGEVLLEALDLEGVAVSAGAACASGSIEPSHVLAAMGKSPEEARASLRFSLGHGVDEAQIDAVLDLLPPLVARVREAAIP